MNGATADDIDSEFNDGVGAGKTRAHEAVEDVGLQRALERSGTAAEPQVRAGNREVQDRVIHTD
ncbi:MAG: hypothetical protein ACYTA3_06085 [Planctomycetota bacterium]